MSRTFAEDPPDPAPGAGRGGSQACADWTSTLIAFARSTASLVQAGVLILAPAASAGAAQAPGTDIWWVPLEGPASEASNLTRRPGYDNQPAFIADGRALLFTSIREDGQADAYRLDPTTREAERLTRTAESEYSPTPLPAGSGFSVVRVERDSTQRLWAFDADGENPRLLLPEVAPVGYHAWSGPGTVVLYVLGDPATLVVSELAAGAPRTVARDVGRSLRPLPGSRAVAFLQRGSHSERDPGPAGAAATAEIRVVDPMDGETERLAPALEGSEDFAFTPDGRLLMARGRTVFAHRPGLDPGWSPLLDLSAVVPGPITRLAVSPDGLRLAFVVGEGETP